MWPIVAAGTTFLAGPSQGTHLALRRSEMERLFPLIVHFGLRAGLLALTACAGAPVASNDPLDVATTADHPPFSVLSNGSYRGISIDLANDFAADLGRPVRFVRTTWETLIADAVAERFDIAMSGIHVTTDRLAVGEFTQPYLTIGKLALVRCSDVGRFASLEDVARLGARILTVRGSSNEDFTRRHFPSSVAIRVVGVPEALLQLTAGEGDLVFADAPHARSHAESDPRLCIGLGGASVGEYGVAFFLPRGSPLLEAAEQWLARRQADGFIERVLEAHFAPATEQPQTL